MRVTDGILFHLNAAVSRRGEPLEIGNYSRLICEIQFARSMGYYLIQIYIPASLIVIISWVSFWLHRNATPARVSLGVTTVLTMTTLMSSTNAALPKISYIKSIDVYLGTCFVMVFASLLEYATVGYLGKRIAMRRSRTAQLSKMAELHRSRCTAAAAAAAAAAPPSNGHSSVPTATVTTVSPTTTTAPAAVARHSSRASFPHLVTTGDTCSQCMYQQQLKDEASVFNDDADVYDGPLMNCFLTTTGASILHNSANLPVMNASSTNCLNSNNNAAGLPAVITHRDNISSNVDCCKRSHLVNCKHKSPHRNDESSSQLQQQQQQQQGSQCNIINCSNVSSNTVTVSCIYSPTYDLLN